MLLAATTTSGVPTWLQIIAAIAAPVAAIAAWRAAALTQRTSEDALEALALTIRPTLSAAYGVRSDAGVERRAYLIQSRSRFDATDIEVEVYRRDGKMKRSSFSVARGIGDDGSYAPPLLANVGDVSPAEIEKRQLFEQVVVRFSDQWKIARYEITHQFEPVFRETERRVSTPRRRRTALARPR